jgi:hypothetical protein
VGQAGGAGGGVGVEGVLNDVMRFTIIDSEGNVSFVAPCRTMEALVAACTTGVDTLDQFLTEASRFMPELKERVMSGLAVFDEHNSREHPLSIHAALDLLKPADLPVFRVIDDRTRQASLQPARAGVIIFNLVGKRIVQIHNTYHEIRRSGRIRIATGEAPAGRATRVVQYKLPAEWSLVPDRGEA